MEYTTAVSGSDHRNIENVELCLSEILLVYLADRLYLSVVVAGDKYCVFGRIQEAVENLCYMLKICHGIWKTGPWNL